MQHQGVPSVATLFGHPVHPMLIPFPIAFLAALPLTDIAYWRSGDPFWLGASWWLCVAGLLTAPLAAFAGSIDFWGRRQIREHQAAWIHLIGNVTAVLITAVNFWLRWTGSTTIPWPWGVPLSLATLGILCLTGWYGGELSYRHRIGMIDPEA